jgi:DNA-binding MarR family transcriptional regulator
MQAEEAIAPEEYRALAEFRFRIRQFIHFSEQAARAVGIEPQQHQLLLALKGFPEAREPTIGDLASRLQLQHHSTVELIDRSVRQGLVERQRGEADRRQVHIRLTPHGEAILRELSVHHRRELRAAAPALVRALDALAITGDPSRTAHGPPDTAALADLFDQ